MLEALDDDFYPYYQENVMESEWHVTAILYLFGALREHLAGRPGVKVFSDMFVYDEEGNRNRKVAPDVFVCFGCAQPRYRVYKTWENGGPPVTVIEVTSESSKRTDQGTKREKYRDMGVQEYILFDPLGDYIPGKLRVFRRRGDDLVPVLLSQPRYRSDVLGVDLVVEEELLRVYNVATGEPYLDVPEQYARLREERARAEKARARAEEQKAQAEEQKARADEQKARADREEARADAEKRRRIELEERLRTLEQAQE